MTFQELSLAIHRYAPALDMEDKVKFCLYLSNKYGMDDLSGLDLAHEWKEYRV